MEATFCCKVLVTVYRGETESVLTGNITNWCGSCRKKDRMAHRVISTTLNLICTHLTSISDTNDERCLHCPPCCPLAKDAEVSADLEAGSLPKLWDSWTNLQHYYTIKIVIFSCSVKELQPTFPYTTQCCRMIINLEPQTLNTVPGK